MAVGKAIDFSNPMVASRINLEAALDKFSQVFSVVPLKAARERLRGFSLSDFDFTAAASDGFRVPKRDPGAAVAPAAVEDEK